MTNSTLPPPPTKTTCAYCGVGCGIDIHVNNDLDISVSGDPQHPANYGRLCSKGSSLSETIDLDGRLLHPSIGGVRSDWDSTLNHIAKRFQDLIRDYGPDSVAFYVSGQLLTEDYYVANKLMKGFIGSGNIDTNSRLCMSSAVAGYKRAFGGDCVPCNYDDLDQTDLLILSGSNAAWCHPVLFRRIEQAKLDRPAMKIIVIDPRRTASCDIADLHLPIKSGMDTTLFNGLLSYLNDHGGLNQAYIDQHTDGFAATLAAAKATGTIEQVAASCELDTHLLEHFYQLFKDTERTVSFYSMGLNQSSSGTDNANSIINVHLATGRIGKPGAGPFSITGQPNAMGGREVGGLANQLAAHMDINNPAHRRLVSEFWQTNRLSQSAGAKAVSLFEKIESGQIKAVWIMATNPVVSLPNADQVKRALKKCDLVIVSDCVRDTDTSAYADILLPATGWGEKDGTVTNSERRISRQRPYRAAAGDARHDWWIISQVAQRMGFKAAFDYSTPWQIFREHARLSAYKNNAEHILRGFNIEALSDISAEEYQNLTPLQWPITRSKPEGSARLFEDNLFFTPNRRAQFIALTPRSRANNLTPKYPLVLNTGRIRDQWHTMTRTGKSARLHSHISEQSVTIHPRDAANAMLENGAIAQIQSNWGSMLARVAISDDQKPGDIFVPMHWSNQFALKSRVDALVNSATDPISGQPEFKHTPANVMPFKAVWYGFIIARSDIDLRYFNELNIDYASKIKLTSGWLYELASRSESDFNALVDRLGGAKSELIRFSDEACGRFRGASVSNNRLNYCVFIEPTPRLPSRTWLSQLLACEITAADRIAILAGKPKEGVVDCGKTVCSCFNVGIKTIEAAITDNNLDSVDAIGARLKAGTNCGSCKPELKQILAQSMRNSTTEALATAV